MANFPRSARTGQTHKKFGRRFIYSETTESWTPISTLASVAEVRTAEQAVSASNTTTYQTAVELPLSGNTAGAMAFVVETNRLYLWSGTGWYNIATIAGASSSISGANSSYTLATDGTPTVITLSQSGLTSPTWSYEVTTGSLGRTATVTQANNVFTITPSTRASDIGSFGLTFKATDGSNTIVTSSQFTMSNTAPVIGTGPSATYTLDKDGTPTVITLAATDADGHAITWSYEVVSGSLGSTTVTNVGSVFTITPSTDEADDGTFQLRFVASDGAASDTDVAEFTLSFAPDWTAATLAYIPDNPTLLDAAVGHFGDAVAASADYVLVGAYGYAGGGGQNMEGRVYVFNPSTNTLVRTLDNPAPESGDYFSRFGSLAISGDYVIVGAMLDKIASGVRAGTAFIFNVTTGALLHTLDNPAVNPDAQESDYFGYSVDISGNYAIVGVPQENNINGTFALYGGRAYIYNVTTGALLHTLDNPRSYGDLTRDEFGKSVAISGNYAVITSPAADLADGTLQAGVVYIYNVTTGALLHTIDSPNPNADQLFGNSVAISGNYAIVGHSYWDAPPNNRYTGKAYIYDVATGTLVHTLDNPNNVTYDWFGHSVDIEGNYCIVGAIGYDANGVNAQGAAYIFQVDTGTLFKTLEMPNPKPGQTAGRDVAIFGSTAVVGSEDWQSDAGRNGVGRAWVFQAG